MEKMPVSGATKELKLCLDCDCLTHTETDECVHCGSNEVHSVKKVIEEYKERRGYGSKV